MTHIEFERSGGFAGLVLAASVDADALPPGVADLDWGALPTAAPEPVRSDGFTYRLAVTHVSGETQSVVLGEPPPAEVRPLLDELVRRARPTP